MLNWLRRLLGPLPPDQGEEDCGCGDMADEVAQLDRRVAHLESEQIELMAEWVKTRDQVLRGVKRMGSLRRLDATRSDDLQLDGVEEPGRDEDWQRVQQEAANLKLGLR